MTDYIATLNFNKINDRALGDLDSRAWSRMGKGYDAVRDDLVTYYDMRKEDVINGRFTQPDNAYDVVRAKEPNNCLSYAFGLVVRGDLNLSPCHFRLLDFANPKVQILDLTEDEMQEKMAPEPYESSSDFVKDITTPQCAPVRGMNAETMAGRRLVIGVHRKIDYHITRLDIAHRDNKPVLTFCEKLGFEKRITEPRNLEEFALKHKKNYRNPTLFAVTDDMKDREFYFFERKKEHRVLIALGPQ